MIGSTPTADVSVVIPCFRATRTIARAIASVATQALLPAELIVVDDGSGDGTSELLDALGHSFPSGWMKVIVLPTNQGAANARNAGWAAASSSCVAFLDADDAWEPDKISCQYEWMRAHPDVALSCHLLPLSDTAATGWRRSELRWREIGRYGLLASNQIFTPTVMLRRTMQWRFPPAARHSEDYWLWLHICLGGMRCVRLEVPLARRYKHIYGAGGLSGQLLAMERAELSNYRALHRSGLIGGFALTFFSLFSIAKFLKRAAVSLLRRRRHD